MIACVDVDYRVSEAIAACVLFRAWSDGLSADEKVELITKVEPYEAGQFYRRELPCLLAVLSRVREPVEAAVVDGYVWLGDDQKPGLGAHLYEALGRTTPVLGVAKTRFMSAAAAEVKRGNSQRPLYVTAAGMSLEVAARHIESMHGPHRIPTLLKRVDRLCRDSLSQPLVGSYSEPATQVVSIALPTGARPDRRELGPPSGLASTHREGPSHSQAQQRKAW